ncbi:MAG: radical SAM protein [Flavobacteriales bacterium]|nr:radical SAM protein [Flavobacteriales bacterium]
MELTDRHSRTHRSLRISIVDKCDLRCTYCMPEDQHFLRREELMTREEIATLARLFTERYGITKIRLTGGEPLMRPDVVDIVRDMAQLPGEARIDDRYHAPAPLFGRTDGRRIEKPQHRFGHLRCRTLPHIKPPRWPRARAGEHRTGDATADCMKLNMVVMRGVNDDELLRFVELTRDRPVHVRFIEFMPFAGNKVGPRWCLHTAKCWAVSAVRTPSKSSMTIAQHGEILPRERLAGHLRGESVQVTEPFCGNCDRLRLTAEGKMRNCLFAREKQPAFRLAARRRCFALGRSERVGEARDARRLPQFNPDKQEEVLHDLSNRPMVSIGG